jgi:ribonuclease HI
MRGKHRLELYCDGSGAPRSGFPGAWAYAIVRDGSLLHAAVGVCERTNSLLMEIAGATEAIESVLKHGWHQEHAVVLISDCSIVLDITRGQFTPRPQQYSLPSLRLRRAVLDAHVEPQWVRAHAGNQWNEHVDALAREARQANDSRPRLRRRLLAG